jgi:hypothetical protein
MLFKNKSNEAGTATVEMAIMMPVYVMLVIVMIYLGGRQVMNIRVMKEVTYFSQKEGEQDASHLANDFLDLPRGAMDYLKKEVTVSDAEIPSDLDEEYLKEVMVEKMYSVTGHYTLEGDQLVYTTNMSVTGFGHYAQKYNLVDTVDELSLQLEKGLTRTETTIEVLLEAPYSLAKEDTAGKSFESGGLINTQASTEFLITHTHSHLLVAEGHVSAEHPISYEDSAIPALLSDDEYPRLPSPSLDWREYWNSNLSTPP